VVFNYKVPNEVLTFAKSWLLKQKFHATLKKNISGRRLTTKIGAEYRQGSQMLAH
jgi:hypothetical protein